AIETDLPAPLVVGAVTSHHRVMRLRQRMVKLVVLRVVFDRVGGRGAKPGPPHSGLKIVLRDLAMAARANPRIDIAVPASRLCGHQIHRGVAETRSKTRRTQPDCYQAEPGRESRKPQLFFSACSS